MKEQIDQLSEFQKMGLEELYKEVLKCSPLDGNRIGWAGLLNPDVYRKFKSLQFICDWPEYKTYFDKHKAVAELEEKVLTPLRCAFRQPGESDFEVAVRVAKREAPQLIEDEERLLEFLKTLEIIPKEEWEQRNEHLEESREELSKRIFELMGKTWPVKTMSTKAQKPQEQSTNSLPVKSQAKNTLTWNENQSRILEFLKAHPNKIYRYEEIAKELNIDKKTVSNNVNLIEKAYSKQNLYCPLKKEVAGCHYET